MLGNLNKSLDHTLRLRRGRPGDYQVSGRAYFYSHRFCNIVIDNEVGELLGRISRQTVGAHYRVLLSVAWRLLIEAATACAIVPEQVFDADY